MRSKPDKPFIVPVFLPHSGCPHRCVFCNQHAITGNTGHPSSRENVIRDIQSFLKFRNPYRTRVQISFYGGNFLGQDDETIRRMLDTASQFIQDGEADSLRFSTRPDTIDVDQLEKIRSYPVSTIELGAQSMDDGVLRLSNRGHTAQDTVHAVSLLRKASYEIGIQMMVGLPGDDEVNALETTRRIIDLSPDFVRIYPTIVLKGSPLAEWYRQGRYVPLSLEECVRTVKPIFKLFQKSEIPVIRFGLQASEELDAAILAGPYHPSFGHLVMSELFLDHAVNILQGLPSVGDSIQIGVHPRNVSKIRGDKNKNLAILKNQFKIKSIFIIPDDSLAEGEVRII